jgi:hypothetical protein
MSFHQGVDRFALIDGFAIVLENDVWTNNNERPFAVMLSVYVTSSPYKMIFSH